MDRTGRESVEVWSVRFWCVFSLCSFLLTQTLFRCLSVDMAKKKVHPAVLAMLAKARAAKKAKRLAAARLQKKTSK